MRGTAGEEVFFPIKLYYIHLMGGRIKKTSIILFAMILKCQVAAAAHGLLGVRIYTAHTAFYVPRIII